MSNSVGHMPLTLFLQIIANLKTLPYCLKLSVWRPLQVKLVHCICICGVDGFGESVTISVMPFELYFTENINRFRIHSLLPMSETDS